MQNTEKHHDDSGKTQIALLVVIALVAGAEGVWSELKAAPVTGNGGAQVPVRVSEIDVAAGSITNSISGSISEKGDGAATASAFQSDATKQRLEALLGLHDVAVTPEQWLSLGPGAGVLLEAIASDPLQRPSRRMRAFEGMVVLGTPRANALLVQAVRAETEPRAVRMAAMRGLGKMWAGAPLLSELGPILQKAGDAQLRGVAAEVLSRDPASLAAVRRQADKETPAWRARFLAGAGAGESLAPLPPKLPISPSRATSAPPDPPVKPPFTPSQPKDLTEAIDLGVVNVVATAVSVPVSVTVPPNGISIDFVGTALSDPTARVVVYYVDSPSQRVYNYASSSNLMKVLPPQAQGAFSLIVPNTPTLPLDSGVWTIRLLASKPTTASVKVLLKRSPVISPTSGTINLNLFFVGVPGLSATSAQTDTNFQAILDTMRTAYGQIGIMIGSLSYIDVTGNDATMYSDLADADLGALMRLSSMSGAQANAANLFFVHTITGGGVLGGHTILGESSGLPGAPILGTTQSGVAVTMSDFPALPTEIGHICSHELGHWLGLFHTTESSGTAFDPLPDTPECSSGTYDVDHNGIVTSTECSSVDGPNEMFWSSDPSVQQSLLTPNQGFVMLRHPLVVTSPPYPLAISSITYSASNTIHLQCVGVPYGVNRIESSPDLSPNSFTNLTSISVSGTGAFQFEDTNAGTQKFYRVVYP